MASTNSNHIPPLPRLVDDVASRNPEQTWILVPKSDNLEDGYRPVTFASLARAVNKMSRWIEKTIGISETRETIAYMGVNDTRYIIFLLAALKTGYKILLTSTRNSTEGQRSLINATQCRKFLFTPEMQAKISAIKDDKTSFDMHQVPEFDDILQQTTGGEHYNGKESDDPDQPAIIIHTSGSTGIPKPIPLKNGWLATVYRLTHTTEVPDNRMTISKSIFDQRSLFVGLPWFHAMGLLMMMRSIYDQGPLVLPPSNVAPSAELTLRVLRIAKPDQGIFPPSVLEDIVELPGGLDTLGTLQNVWFGGAPLSHDIGDKLAKLPRTKLQTVIGSTEASVLDSFVNEDDADWEYFEWVPHAGIDMQSQGDGTAEAVIKPLHNDLQGAFFSFPELSEWRTKDLFAPHPKRPGLWRYKGRNDDVIVLSNGEKFGPVDLEKTVESHPAVHGALVVGQGRFQAGLIVEPDPKHAEEAAKDVDRYIELIWPTVQKANGTVAAHARVWKSKIAIAKPDKPFERAPKGSIMRRKTNNLYEKEIEALYSNEAFADQLAKLSPGASRSEILETVRKAIQLSLPNLPHDVKNNEDLLAYGVDSLGILGFASALNHVMPEGENVIKPRTIYSNPSINGMMEILSSILRGDKQSEQVPREQRMSAMVAKYTKQLPAPVSKVDLPKQHVVALTGSTGSLGTYLLHLLLSESSVEKVYCLNRSADGESRQKQAFTERSMKPDFGKVEFVQASFGKEAFGLSSVVYKQMQDTVDVFIHNAWAVDFNMGLESFEDTHISGTHRCIEFSASSRYHPEIVFVSSIASVGNWEGSGNKGYVPETLLEDDSVSLPQGYGESKHVSGRILAAAARGSGVPAVVVRVGQLAGPVTEKGVWNKQEWFPSIVSSSKAIGKVPRNLGNMDTVDWVPVDAAAKVLLELSFNTLAERKASKENLSVYHLVNPKTEVWQNIVPIVQEYFDQTHTRLEIVEYSDWLETLKKMPMSKENAARVPGLKLLDFYEGLAAPKGLPRLATDKTAAMSPTLENIGSVNREMMKLWLEQWDF
ncbi:hypothetical protein MBLNU457_7181t1 [Dothideomycetes sp. NU457]